MFVDVDERTPEDGSEDEHGVNHMDDFIPPLLLERNVNRRCYSIYVWQQMS